MTLHPVQDVLDRFGASVDETTIAAVMEQALQSSSAWSVVTPSGHDHDVAIERSGLGPREQRQVREALEDPATLGRIRAEAAARASAWTVTALSQPEVMRRLGLRSPSGLSRRIAEGRVYVVPVAGEKLFPDWQFVAAADDSDRLVTLPGLDDVVRAATELHPVSVAAVMAGEHEELGGRTGRQWLIDGAPTGPVVDLLVDASVW